MFAYVSANKKKIINEVTAAMSSKLNGTVNIGNVELSFFTHFPKVAVLLHDVSITDTLFPQHHHRFLEAKKVFLNLSILRLIQKQPALNGLIVQEGSVYLYTDSTGYTNTYLAHPKNKSTAAAENSGGDNELKSIELENVHITLDDRRKEKLHDFLVARLKVKINDEESIVKMQVNADIGVKNLAFNIPRGSFLKDKSFAGNFDMEYQKQTGRLVFDSIKIKLQNMPFRVSGSFDLKGESPQFLLRVHARNVNYEAVKTLLPGRIGKSLSIVTLDKPLDADAIISGPLNGGEPLVTVNWLVNKSRLTSPFMDFDEASFSGYYKNEVTPGLSRNDANSVIILNDFTATWHGLPVNSGHIEILNLEVPLLSCDLQSAFSLPALNNVLQANAIQMKSGNAVMKLSYKGPIEKNNNSNSFINGNIQFSNGTVLYAPRNVLLNAVNGNIVFKNSDLMVENLQCDVLNNKIVMNGTAKNLLSLINTAPNKVLLDWNIYSPQLNLGSFIYLLKSSNSSGKKSNNTQQSISSQIDEMLDQSQIHVKLAATKVLYKKFTAENLSASISLLPDRYVLDNVSMATAGGKMSLSGQLLNNQNSNHATSIKAKLDNVDVKKIFYSFENFGQDGITSQSLEGNLTATATATFLVNEDGKILPSSASGDIDFSLKNGALNNYEPIKKIQDFIFKKRDFDNIQFAELKDRLQINKGEITINRMEIQSSVLSLFVQGVYSQKGNTDISIQVPFSNLKKRKEDYIPENNGVQKKAGRSIFLRGRTGDDGNVKFKLDLFNGFKKDQKTNSEQ